VVGAGLVGLATARALAGHGLLVELLESRRAGAGASSAGAGLLAPISDWASTRPVLSICRRARDDWRAYRDELVAETGVDVEFDDGGALLVACDEQDERWLSHEASIARDAEETWEELPVAEARALVPDLSPTVRRVARLAGEHRVDNVAACAALAESCRRRGVRLREGFAVERVRTGAAAVTVDGGGERLESDRLVIATGAWSGAIPGLPALPVRPVRGQMLRVDDAAWPWRGSLRWRERYVVRRGAAGLLVGATVEEAGFDERPTADGIAGLLDFSRALFPRLARAPLASVWAGLRPGSPDGRPLLGPIGRGSDRLFAACGHYRNGILLAPWTGEVLARWIVEGIPFAEAELFAPGRFDAATPEPRGSS
jgi:glycine oxidase